MKRDTWVLLGVLGVAGYLAYRFLSKGAQAVSAVTSPISTGIANAILYTTLPPGITVTGNVVTPDAVIPLQNLPGLVPDASGNVYFTYQGSRYQILPGWDAQGNRQAIEVQ